MEYYSATHRNEELLRATIWINLENNRPSLTSQIQNATHCMIPFTETVQNRQIQRQTVDVKLPGAAGEGRMGNDS